MIRILLVDDHASFRQPLAFMLGREPDLEVIGQAGSLAEARKLVDDADVALVDLDLPDGDGVDFIVDLVATNPQSTALVLTGSVCPSHHARALAAGAAAVLRKSVTIDDVIHAVRRLRPDGRGRPSRPTGAPA